MERQDKWTRKNGIPYSAIVEGCEGHNGTMLVVMQRKASDNAKELYEGLLKKFRVHHTALLQNGVANFNILKMAPNETGSNFINRILQLNVDRGYATDKNFLTMKNEKIRDTKASKNRVSCKICNVLCVEDRTKHVNVLTDMILHLSVQEDLRR